MQASIMLSMLTHEWVSTIKATGQQGAGDKGSGGGERVNPLNSRVPSLPAHRINSFSPPGWKRR